ncbi:MAG: sulfurtransferase [Gammaproteobacteria bacterium]|nr:sulfurtransferase [Gammaproteobacteria bacterium]
MSQLQLPSSLVSVNWLQENQNGENLVILDASVPPIIPFTSRAIPEDITQRHIPGALRFDYDKKICDQSANFPHMMPDADYFAAQVRKLGISNESAVLIYDNVGVYASPRAWWMFKAMGHDNVAVLDGGSVAWYQAGLKMSAELPDESSVKGRFDPAERSESFCDAMAVYQLLHDSTGTVVDARSEGRFYGRDPEPRNNLRGGHMPGSKCVPFQRVLNEIYMKPPEELRLVLGEVANPAQLMVATCGSGLSACILTLAAELAGFKKLSVYDASWCEWGLPGKLPVTLED